MYLMVNIDLYEVMYISTDRRYPLPMRPEQRGNDHLEVR